MLVIAERISVPLDSLQDVALANAQVADPSAKLVFRHKRRVNGVVLWFLKIEAEIDSVPMVYWGYYYADRNSTVQVASALARSDPPLLSKTDPGGLWLSVEGQVTFVNTAPLIVIYRKTAR